MRPSEWARERLEHLARHYPLVWVEDPYRLLNPPDLDALQAGSEGLDHETIVVRSAFRLREKLEGRIPDRCRLIVIDQSQTMREPHLLPKDASPKDFRPIPAPDWKPHVPPDARFRPSVRDYLIEVTGDAGWPPEVNLFPYERLARDTPDRFIEAFDTFRRMGRPLTSADLQMVGASTILGVDLFDATHPLRALGLAFHSEDRWNALRDYFNAGEIEVVRARLAGLPAPVGDLFGENRDAARLAVVALRVLAQHFEKPGKHLKHLGTALASFRSCEVDATEAPPSWFVQHEIPRFDRQLTPEFLDHVRDELNLDDRASAREFAVRERLSPRLRELVPFDVVKESVSVGSDDDLNLTRLVPEFREKRDRLATLVASVKPLVERLKLRPPAPELLDDILKTFLERGFYQADVLAGRIETLIRHVDVAVQANGRLSDAQVETWQRDAAACRDLVGEAGQLRDTLDYLFGKVLEKNYGQLVPAKRPTTDVFYEGYVTQRRRQVGGKAPRKAVVLVMDSMRFDIWREMVRPVLERDYRVDESIGFALLPSETHVSRRSLFAGKPPAATPAGPESRLFGELLSAVHQQNIALADLPRPQGSSLAVASLDGVHTAYVFDFIDDISHKVAWDPATFQEALKPFLTEVRVALMKAGRDALVFVTADHGHMRPARGTPIRIEGSDDVGYRSAYVSRRLEGIDASHVFQIPAETLRHGKPGWYVFPMPGYSLVPDDRDRRRNRATESNRHGGISLFEVVVPFVTLTHREAPVQLRLVASVRERAVANVPCIVTVAVSADGVLESAVEVRSHEPGVEPALVTGVSTNPVVLEVRYTPASPGRRTVRLEAWLGGEPVGSTEVEIDVAPAPAPEDTARTKLSRMFGDD